MWNLDYTKPYDRTELDEINNIQNATKRELKEKYPFWTGTFVKTAYKQEMPAKLFDQGENIINEFMVDELKPDPEWILTKEKLDELTTDLPDSFRSEFAHAHSEGHAQQIRNQLFEYFYKVIYWKRWRMVIRSI